MTLLIFIAVPALAPAEDVEEEDNADVEEIVVTATRIETPAREVASSVTVISGAKIEKTQESLVLDVLKNAPSIDVARTGGPGGTTSVFIRGAKSEHTLVLIDGIEMNNPISTGRTFNFANLTTDNIERIEIIRGPQSTLYGSDAMGGVINIITKKGTGGPHISISAEAGSFDTYRENAALSGADALFNYSLSLSREDAVGFSAANEKDGNTERDGYQNTTVSTRLGFTPTDELGVDFVLRYTDSRADIDNAGGAGGDDPNNTDENKQLFLRTVARINLFDGFWVQRFGFSLSDQDEENNNGKDPSHPSDLTESTFNSNIVKFDWQHDLYLHKTNTVTAGFEYEEEEGESRFHSESAFGPFTSDFDNKKARTRGVYLQDQIKLFDSLFTTLGVRTDYHSKFGSETTYHAAAAYILKGTGTKVRGTFGTGFKAPSLFQLFSQYGDVNLTPEKSTGWDIGLEQTLLNKKAAIEATYFRNDFDDLIDFDSSTSTYKNISKAWTRGVELSASLRPVDVLTLSANYTYTDTEDKTTGAELLRRASNKFGFDLSYRFLKKGNVNLGVKFTGERDDLDFSTFPATTVRLGSYTLVNLAASYDISKHVRLHGRIENLLDEDYEEVLGFGAAGISAFAGVKVSL
ncbi:MAG: TonB-dependent receptor plug domain-containing protein [Thermodesulfobacteriota bacterium]